MSLLPDFLADIKTYFLSKGISRNVDAAVILGSGLGDFTDHISNPVEIPYDGIPGFSKTSVVGHKGAVYFGEVSEKYVMAFAGRFHHYEGYPLEKTILPAQVAQIMGGKLLVVSNAAGGINYRFRVGDLMLIDDLMHLGKKLTISTQPELFRYRNEALMDRLEKLASGSKIPVRKGTYLFMTGPTYETKAEVRAFRFMGADAVGMSTAPELLEATRLGMDNIGISLITNMATGVSKGKLDHSEIKEAAELRKNDFARLVAEIIRTES